MVKKLFYTILLSVVLPLHADSPKIEDKKSKANEQEQIAKAREKLIAEGKVAAWHIEGCITATAYLQHLREDQYAESWQLCDPIFQRAINKDDWIADMKYAKEDYGSLTTRTLTDQRLVWDPQDMPKGPYLVIEYETATKQFPQIKEVLTLRKGDDNQWRILVYQIQPQ